MLKVGDKLPAGSLQEFIEVEGNGCTIGPNTFDVEKATAGKTIAVFGLRMQKATQQLTNHSQLKNTRRDIARVKTIQTEQKRAAAAGAPAAAKGAAQKTGAKK